MKNKTWQSDTKLTELLFWQENNKFKENDFSVLMLKAKKIIWFSVSKGLITGNIKAQNQINLGDMGIGS